jgi:hypothetical protein
MKMENNTWVKVFRDLRDRSMNISPIEIITIFLVITAVVFAGCTDSAPSDTSVTTLQNTSTIPTTTGTPQVTPTRQQATTADGKVIENPVKVFNGDYHWVEYRNNITQTLPPNPRYQWEQNERVERSESDYNGVPAIHYKITTTLDYPEWVGDKLIHSENGWIIVSDSYYDTLENTFLGGTSSETIKGVKKPATELPAGTSFNREEKPTGEMGITPFGEMNITLTYEGIESVTVPAGTYTDARKYTGKFRDGTPITFWVVPGIPVPVLYQFPNNYLDGVDPFQSYELKGWV